MVRLCSRNPFGLRSVSGFQTVTSIMRAIYKIRITILDHLIFYTLSHLKTENDEEKDSVSSEQYT